MLNRLKIFLSVTLMAYAVFSASIALAKQEIRVSIYAFPPFVNEDLKSGLTPELVKLINKHQDEFEFTTIPTSPMRRYSSFEQNEIDLMFFEMDIWSWQKRDIPIQKTREVMKGHEVYIALKKPGRDQSFFNDITSKTISAFRGYHYGFANFNNDPAYLKENFDVQLSSSHQRNLDLVLFEAVEVGVVTQSFLQNNFQKYPDLKEKLLVSNKMDQRYSLPILISENAKITVDEMERIMEKLKKTGELQALFESMGLQAALTF